MDSRSSFPQAGADADAAEPQTMITTIKQLYPGAVGPQHLLGRKVRCPGGIGAKAYMHLTMLGVLKPRWRAEVNSSSMGISQ